jgi:hypothetical protein
MGTPSYMLSVVNRSVVGRIPVYQHAHPFKNQAFKTKNKLFFSRGNNIKSVPHLKTKCKTYVVTKYF